MPGLGLSTAFNAFFLIITLAQIGHCLHLLRLSTPLKSTTWLLLVGSLCYLATWSVLIAADVVAAKLTNPVELNPIRVEASLIERALPLELAGGVLNTLGFSLVAVCILYTIAAAEEGKVNTVCWVGAGMVAISATLDVASLGYSHWLKITLLHTPSTLLRGRPFSTDIAVVLGLGIPAFVFEIAFLVVLGKVGKPYKEDLSRPLHLVSRVILPALIIRLVLVIVNAIVINVTTVDDLYRGLFGSFFGIIEPLVVGYLLRITYMWKREEYRPFQTGQESMASLPFIKEEPQPNEKGRWP